MIKIFYQEGKSSIRVMSVDRSFSYFNSASDLLEDAFGPHKLISVGIGRSGIGSFKLKERYSSGKYGKTIQGYFVQVKG